MNRRFKLAYDYSNITCCKTKQNKQIEKQSISESETENLSHNFRLKAKMTNYFTFERRKNLP